MSGSADLVRGARVGRYRVEAVLGRGGMSVVYLAEDLRLKRKVALKVLAAALAENERFRQRFLSESELAASLDHGNVIPIYEAGQAGDSLFIAMRYVEGSDLKALLREGPLPDERAVAVAAQVAGALDAAHTSGLVHGDVKPSNVLIDAHGHAYLADFGLTKRLGDPRSPEGDAQLLGTIDYVAPEQIRGEQVDGRADVYSLGCVLYECLTGRQPFQRGNDAAVLYAHLEDEPPATGGPADPVIATALAKSPDDRYQTCAELVEAAREALGVTTPRRSRWAIAIATVAILLAAGAIAAFLTLRGGSGAAATPHGTVVRIDPRTNRVTETASIGTSPTGITTDPGHVWVTTLDDQGLWRIATATDAATRVPIKGLPLAVAAHHGELLVAEELSGTWGGYGGATADVAIVDPEGTSVAQTISTGTAATVAAGGAGLWLLREQGPTQLRVESSLAAAIGRQVPLPGAADSGTALAVGGNDLWVLSDVFRRMLWRIDSARGTVVATIPLPFAPAAVAADARGAWVTAQLDDRVARVDPLTDRIVATIGVGREPLAVAIGGGAVWVANTVDRTVTRIDPATNRVAATIPVGRSPTAITVGNGSVWVATDAS